MARPRRSGFALALALAALALAAAPTVSAHVTETVGPYTVTLGWVDEPPFAGVKNAVEVGVVDDKGKAVTDLGTSPEIEVAFGDAQTVIPLVPSEEPGIFQAALIPTRPGTYTFTFNATIDGRAISVDAICSETTFECVGTASDPEFPVKDPSVGEIADRVAVTLPKAEQASDDASTARTIAIAALALAAVSLVASFSIVRRERRRGE